MKKNSGFSLIELIIVIAITGIMASVASFAWQRYVNNNYLRTAAREITTDFSAMKANARSQSGTTYTIAFDSTAGTYTLTGTTTQVKSLTTLWPGITFSALPGGGSTYTLTFMARGTLNPTTGTIVLRNSRGSTASIVYNMTGKTYVTFNMQ